MLYQCQLIKNAKGDCLRTCIANLLETPMMAVPNFSAMEGKAGTWDKWWLELQSWLKQRGYFFLEVVLTDKTPWFPIPFGALCMFVGYTNATKGQPDSERHRHIVCGKVEDEKFVITHDPLPEGSGIENVEAICFLVPLDPAKMFKNDASLCGGLTKPEKPLPEGKGKPLIVVTNGDIEGLQLVKNPEYDKAPLEMDSQTGAIKPRPC